MPLTNPLAHGEQGVELPGEYWPEAHVWQGLEVSSEKDPGPHTVQAETLLPRLKLPGEQAMHRTLYDEARR